VVVAQMTDNQDLPHVRPGSEVHLRWSPGAAYLIDGWPSVAGATSTDVDDIEAAL
jgi:hypothetical protein